MEQARSVTAQLAGLQAPFWDDADAVGGAHRFYNRLDDHIEGLAERYATSWGTSRRPRGGRPRRAGSARWSSGSVRGWSTGAATVTGPRTLVHQDLRLDNLLWGHDGAWLVDWQTLAWTTPAWDLAFYPRLGVGARGIGGPSSESSSPATSTPSNSEASSAGTSTSPGRSTAD